MVYYIYLGVCLLLFGMMFVIPVTGNFFFKVLIRILSGFGLLYTIFLIINIFGGIK